MDLRTRYIALVTLMTQYIKFAGDSLKRLEEEEVGHSLSVNQAKITSRQTKSNTPVAHNNNSQSYQQMWKTKIPYVVHIIQKCSSVNTVMIQISKILYYPYILPVLPPIKII